MFASPRCSIAMCVGLLSLALAGCAGGGSATSASSPGPSPTPTPTPSPNSPTFSFTPASLNFGSVTAGSPKTSPISMSNTGAATITVSQLNVGNASFSIAGFTLPEKLNAGQTVSGTITFSPAGAGTITGSIVAMDSSGVLGTLSLSGTGIVATAHSVDVTWVASSSTGVASYDIYRSKTSGGPYTKIGNSTGTLFTDSTVKSGTTYFYVVTSMTSLNVESVISGEVTAVVPTP